MRTIGIICECNPLHDGHLYLLSCARKSGADVAVAVMSSCFVQRGEAAIADPYARAEILVRCGFDAVVSLPFPYAAASAEFFGAAGVDILSRLGVDEVWFGSECGDVELLSRIARVADDETFLARYRGTVKNCDGTARAYFDALREACEEQSLTLHPNDILALSYIRAIQKSGSRIRPVTVKRKGCGYNDQALTDAYPSATALRRAWREVGLEAIRSRLPAPAYEVLARESANGRAPASLSHAEALVLGHLRLRDPARLTAELDEGLSQRLTHAASRAATLDEFYVLCATKKYTDARIRRATLFSLCGVTDADLRVPVAYTRLLAANRTGCAFLSSVRKSATISVVTRQTDLPQSEAAQRQYAWEARERSLWSLCLPRAESGEALARRTPLILEEK